MTVGGWFWVVLGGLQNISFFKVLFASTRGAGGRKKFRNVHFAFSVYWQIGWNAFVNNECLLKAWVTNGSILTNPFKKQQNHGKYPLSHYCGNLQVLKGIVIKMWYSDCEATVVQSNKSFCLYYIVFVKFVQLYSKFLVFIHLIINLCFFSDIAVQGITLQRNVKTPS